MKKQTLILLAMATLWNPTTDAGEGSGVRGGDVVICKRPNGIPETSLLDYFESSVDPKKAPTLDGKTWIEKVESFIQRLSALDYILAQDLREYWVTFQADMLLTDRVKIPEIDDSTPFYKTKENCRIKQIAVQYLNPRPFEARYLIDQDLWIALSETHKAGLAIHEMLYRSALNISLDLKNSDGVRYFNGIMSSAFGKTLTLKSYYTIAEASGIGRSLTLNYGSLPVSFEYSFPTYNHEQQKIRFSKDSENKIEAMTFLQVRNNKYHTLTDVLVSYGTQTVRGQERPYIQVSDDKNLRFHIKEFHKPLSAKNNPSGLKCLYGYRFDLETNELIGCIGSQSFKVSTSGLPEQLNDIEYSNHFYGKSKADLMILDDGEKTVPQSGENLFVTHFKNSPAFIRAEDLLNLKFKFADGREAVIDQKTVDTIKNLYVRYYLGSKGTVYYPVAIQMNFDNAKGGLMKVDICDFAGHTNSPMSPQYDHYDCRISL